MKLSAIISQIEALEAKQDNGTITMSEQAYLCALIEIAESKIYAKPTLTIVR